MKNNELLNYRMIKELGISEEAFVNLPIDYQEMYTSLYQKNKERRHNRKAIDGLKELLNELIKREHMKKENIQKLIKR